MAGLRGCSPNTISSYRDTFKLLICYLRDERSIPPERLTLELIDVTTITAFLAWLRAERHNSPSTCNQRLAAISSFFGWLQSQDPARMACCQDILQIPSSKHDQPAIAHLTVEQTRLLLALPDRSTRQGRRDATLLATLYDTAARVQELADLTVRDIRLEEPAIVALTGKGRKTRHVPIDTNTTALLAAYLAERQLNSPGHDDRPVFFNQHQQKLSRGGIAWILHKYQAHATDPTLADAQLSPHVLRHSRAMHLYDAGVPLPYIRDILGHVDLSTTEIYARASTEAKRKALEAVHDQAVSADLPEWNQNPDLLNWLTNSLSTSPLCAAFGRQPRLTAEPQASTAHNPALLIWSLVGSARGAWAARHVLARLAWFPPAATSNRACGSPAHGSPTFFTAGIQRPLRHGRLGRGATMVPARSISPIRSGDWWIAHQPYRALRL